MKILEFLSKFWRVLLFSVLVGLVLRIFFNVPVKPAIGLTLLLGLIGIVWEAMDKKRGFFFVSGTIVAVIMMAFYRPVYLTDAKAKIVEQAKAAKEAITSVVPEKKLAKKETVVYQGDVAYKPGQKTLTGVVMRSGDKVYLTSPTKPYRLFNPALHGLELVSGDMCRNVALEGNLVIHGDKEAGSVHVEVVRPNRS